MSRDRRTVLILLAILFVSVAVSSYRVIKVPILQCPDEESHLDYAFGIYSAGRLLNAGTTPSSGWHVKARAVAWEWERISHIKTLYLTDKTEMHRIIVTETQKVRPDYGTKDFFRKLDDGAPRRGVAVPELDKRDNPWLVTGYPFLYYAAVALVMGAVSLFTDSITVAFFSGRFLSVAMLGMMLVLSYALCREMRMSRTRSLILVGATGMFPLTSYVTSCIQPDNLALVLVLASFLAAAKIDRAGTWGPKLMLALALGLLVVTKYHVFVCVFVPVMGLLLLRRKILWAEAVAMALPTAALFGVQLWVVWGGGRLTGENLRLSPHGLLKGILDAVKEFYFGGYAYTSYWSTYYGWPHVPAIAKVLVQTCVVLMLALTLYYYAVYGLRVARAVWRSRGDPRCYLISPVAAAHLCFSLAMIGLFALTDNSTYAQGRHFYPFFIPGILVPVVLAPTVFRAPLVRRVVSGTLLGGLVVISVLGQIHATHAMLVRYYP